MARPRIALLALGGTIASPVDAAGTGATATLTADDIAGDLGMRADVDLETRTLRMIASSNLTLDDVRDLARLIAETDADGIVVTVGTDALEEVAFALDASLAGNRPVVVTGAMRNVGHPGPDGPANLLGALRVAAHPDARGQGVIVVFADEVHSARYVRKTHTSSPATFRSPTLGPLGFLVEDRVRLPFARRRRPAAVPFGDGPLPSVALVRVTLGDDPALITAAASTGCAGLVLETFGAGHVAAASLPALREAASRMPVVFASRTGSGELYEKLAAFPGSERDLRDAGLIPAGDLDGAKARLLLVLLLSSGADERGIRAAFADV